MRTSPELYRIRGEAERALWHLADDGRAYCRYPESVPHSRAGDENAAERPVLTVAQVFTLAELVGRRPIGNVRKLPAGGYRLRFQRHGEMRTLPEVHGTRAKAELARCGNWPKTAGRTAVMTAATPRWCCWLHLPACGGAK